jgi:YD repeat-containing protein
MTVSGAIEYDALGRISRHGQPVFSLGPAVPVGVAMTNPTSVTYDGFSRVVRTDYPDGTFTRTDIRISNSGTDTPP